jgi:hypothetical protein
MISVANWAHRALRGIPRYHHGRDEPDYCQRFAPSANEEIVGVYENPPPAQPSAIIITESGLYWASTEGTQHVEFSSLRSVLGPTDKTGSEVKLGLRDGGSRIIRIEGNEGKYRDVFSVVRFLDRVMDLKLKEQHGGLAE